MFRAITLFVFLSLALGLSTEQNSEGVIAKSSLKEDSDRKTSFIASSEGTYDLIVKVKTTNYHSLASTYKKSKLVAKIKDAKYMALTVTKDELDDLISSGVRVEQDHKIYLYDNLEFENETTINSHHDQRRRLNEFIPWNIEMVLQNVEFFKNAVPEGSVKVCVIDTGE